MMMMKAAKLQWAGAGQGWSRAGMEQGRSRPGAKQEQGRSMGRSMSNAGTKLNRIKLSRAKSGQELGSS